MKQSPIEWLHERLSISLGDELKSLRGMFVIAKEMEEQNYLDLIRFLRTQDKMGKSAEDLLEQFKMR